MALIRFFIALLSATVALVLAAPLLLLASPFLGVAAATRALARRREPRSVGWDELIEYDPELGWKPKPDLDRHYLTVAGDAICRARTDSEGWPASAGWSACDTVVIGDSFAFGYGVDADDAFFSVGSGGVKALGAPGYNMAQELLLMKQIAPRLAGKTVVWWICLGNDLLDNLLPGPIGYRTPFMRQDGTGAWTLTTDHVSPERWTLTKHPEYGEALARLCTSGFLADRAYAAAEALLREGHATCEAAGAKLVVLTIPAPAQMTEAGLITLRSHLEEGQSLDPDYPDERISAICAELGVPFLATRKELGSDHYKRVDPHWNRKGHARIAKILERITSA